MVRDGWYFILPLLVLAGLSAWAARNWGADWACWIPAGLFLALALFCAYFFRDPSRLIPSDPRVLVSPADGEVILVKQGRDPFVGSCREVHIFMNLFNVHVQRSPFTSGARVRMIRYHKGKFLAANVPKASLENEQNWIGLQAGGGRKVLVKQIAGLVARRVVCRVREKDIVEGGARLGLIRFGSQVDLLFPGKAEVLVKKGDKVLGGETLMARFSR